MLVGLRICFGTAKVPQGDSGQVVPGTLARDLRAICHIGILTTTNTVSFWGNSSGFLILFKPYYTPKPPIISRFSFGLKIRCLHVGQTGPDRGFPGTTPDQVVEPWLFQPLRYLVPKDTTYPKELLDVTADPCGGFLVGRVSELATDSGSSAGRGRCLIIFLPDRFARMAGLLACAMPRDVTCVRLVCL